MATNPISIKSIQLLLFLSFFTTLADDWKCDQIHWRHYGRKNLKTDPVIMKSYYVFVVGEGSECKLFMTSAYTI